MILVIAIYVVGIFLKKVESIKDNYITIILMLFGITFAIFISIINDQYKVTLNVIANGALQGILCWIVDVELIKLLSTLTKEE